MSRCDSDSDSDRDSPRAGPATRRRPARSIAMVLATLALLPAVAATAGAAHADASPAAERTARAALGRAATAAELRAWDIDVRPDFQGLPPGQGTVAQGQKLWDSRCASCHGDFGESNHVFTPIAGGTTAADIERGRVAAMTGGQPYRTTLMKLSTVSTLWDYIHRAMPWDAPKSLTVDEVYAVTAYVLNLGDIVPADFTLSDRNIGEVQRRLPNRGGMTTAHGLWPGRGRPDTHNRACMRDCAGKVEITSLIPEYAHGAHGDLAGQQRGFGPVRGIATGSPEDNRASSATGTAAKAGTRLAGDGAGARLAGQYQCMACHAVDRKLVGPSFSDIAARYHGQDAAQALATKIRAGGQGAWGPIPMPAQSQVPEADIQVMVRWILEAK